MLVGKGIAATQVFPFQQSKRAYFGLGLLLVNHLFEHFSFLSVTCVAVAVVVIIRQHDDHHLCSCPTVLSWQLYGLVGSPVFECPAACGCNHTERYHILAEAA